MKSLLTKRKTIELEMKRALASLNAEVFLNGGMLLKDLAYEQMERGFHEQARKTLETLDSITHVYAKKSFLVDDQRFIAEPFPADFVEAIAPLFSKNSHIVMRNFGVSESLDGYLLRHKIDFNDFYGIKEDQAFFYTLRNRRMLDEFTVTLGCKIREFEELQDLTVKQNKHADEEDKSEAYLNREYAKLLLRPFYGNSPAFKISSKIDEKLMYLFSRILDLHEFVLTKKMAGGLLQFGLRKTLGYLVENVRFAKLDLDHIESMGEITCSEAGRLFGLAENSSIAAAIIPRLMKYSLRDIQLVIKPFGLKGSIYSPHKIIQAAGQHFSSESYSNDQEEKLLAILAVGVRGVSLKDKNKALSAREKLNEAGIPDRIQFKIREIKNIRGDILEAELGL